jgi:arylsulfatase A-like enzyme
LTLFDLHDFLDGVPDISVQTDLSIDLHNYGVDSSKSVFHSYDSNRIDRYLSELKRIDFYLKFLFDYISNNYQDEEIVLSICSDHGQSYLTDEEEILSRGRVIVPMFFKSEEAPFLTNNELVSNVDYLPSILNLSKINFEHDSIDGELPTIFGGKNGREYAISESIYPDQPYKAVIHKHNEFFYVNSTNNISNIDNIDIEKLELKLEKCLISDDGSIQYTKPDKDDLSKCIDMLIKR